MMVVRNGLGSRRCESMRWSDSWLSMTTNAGSPRKHASSAMVTTTKRSNTPVLVMGTRVYLSGISNEELPDRHCLIVPIQHLQWWRLTTIYGTKCGYVTTPTITLHIQVYR
ncbi:hypothetical protein DFH29DRAFT_502852 [Suillus ampliporus]|nr:hypothetical protein DFH29DRAFT_502852 [Suillus ampliporus]